jgi:hypothetical protein
MFVTLSTLSQLRLLVEKNSARGVLSCRKFEKSAARMREPNLSPVQLLPVLLTMPDFLPETPVHDTPLSETSSNYQSFDTSAFGKNSSDQNSSDVLDLIPSQPTVLAIAGFDPIPVAGGDDNQNLGSGI